MPIYLVRHAKAGERRTWDGDDIDRPLSSAGWRQSAALAERLARKDPSVLLSSPYVRCVQTLEPLGLAIDVPVTIEQRLCEDEPFEPVLDLLGEIPDRAVLCSHGDIIPATIRALVRRGMDVVSEPEWRKASVWVVKRSARGRFSRAKAWPPPGAS
ncbi:MAG: phosphoglycerate mutase family protein [Actinomycetota bacterium]|nr:phosphoglycerate mutase family protein [Actinomycetota bacterium]MDA3006745.1 phosphoglycerate mutase family protein [Actinomycetota bacterium]MDA3033748.1 phosphoglycerate mutase family protein [Actinomycetota bacterium]